MSTVYTPSASELVDITIPSDGDARTAASVNAPLESLADGVLFTQEGVDALNACYQCVSIRTVTGTNLGLSLADGGTTTQTISLLSSGPAVAIGDIVEVELVSTFQFIKGATVTNPLTIEGLLQQNPNGGGLADIPGAKVKAKSAAIASKSQDIPFALLGVFTVAAAGTLAISAKFDLTSSNASDQAGGATSYTALYKVWRLL